MAVGCYCFCLPQFPRRTAKGGILSVPFFPFLHIPAAEELYWLLATPKRFTAFQANLNGWWWRDVPAPASATSPPRRPAMEFFGWIVGRVPYRRRGHLHWQSGYYGRILVGFPYVAPHPPSSPFFRVKSHVVPQSQSKEAGERAERRRVCVCVCVSICHGGAHSRGLLLGTTPRVLR